MKVRKNQQNFLISLGKLSKNLALFDRINQKFMALLKSLHNLMKVDEIL
jgi:hypothetical protein